MRLTLSVLAAILCHGVLFGVAAVLSRYPAAAVPAIVEIDVVAARPDPIAVAAPAAVRAPADVAPVPPRRRPLPRQRPVALVGETARLPFLAGDPSLVRIASATTAANGSAAATRSPARPTESAGDVPSAKPRYLNNPKPEYPIPCSRRREEGVVLLNVAVEPDGSPSEISLSRSSGHPLLDQAALDAVRRWRFDPARAGGVPVRSLVEVPIRFSLADLP